MAKDWINRCLGLVGLAIIKKDTSQSLTRGRHREQIIASSNVGGPPSPKFEESIGLAEKQAFPSDGDALRQALAVKFISGSGLEIGALHRPLLQGSFADVKYVDRMAEDELRPYFVDLDDVDFVPVDIIDDGEELSTVEANSQDFVIAIHLLEHFLNPIRAVGNMLRVLKPGGILFLAVPDKRYNDLDRNRPETTYEHLLRDFNEGPEWSKRDHYMEYARIVDGLTDENVMLENMRRDNRIHFHVWTNKELFELFSRVREIFVFEVEVFWKNGHEVIIILRKPL